MFRDEFFGISNHSYSTNHSTAFILTRQSPFYTDHNLGLTQSNKQCPIKKFLRLVGTAVFTILGKLKDKIFIAGVGWRRLPMWIEAVSRRRLRHCRTLVARQLKSSGILGTRGEGNLVGPR